MNYDSDYKEVESYKNVFNGIAVNADPNDISKLRKSDFVEEIYPDLEVRSLLMDSVPLINANDVHNLGFTGGTFVSIGYEITAPITGFTDYLEWEIQMGCTTEEEMTTWISGLTTVYQADTTNPVQGMNTYNFT